MRDGDVSLSRQSHRALDPHDAPGRFLSGTEHAARIIRKPAQPPLRLMFDGHRVRRMDGDLTRRFDALRDLIGHVHFTVSSIGAEPDEGEIAYDRALTELARMGYDGVFGTEYKPRSETDAGLVWLQCVMNAS